PPVTRNSDATRAGAIGPRDDSEIRVDGLFSLGYPRDDGGEEIDARFRVARRDLDSLRHVFQIDEYPVGGRLSGDFHLTGEYTRPSGVGAMTSDGGVAYGEPFGEATAARRFERNGVRLDNIQMSKGTGAMKGAAYVGWDGTYAFNADGTRVPVDRMAFLQYPGTTVGGLAEFTATGSGTFDVPRNDVR